MWRWDSTVKCIFRSDVLCRVPPFLRALKDLDKWYRQVRLFKHNDGKLVLPAESAMGGCLKEQFLPYSWLLWSKGQAGMTSVTAWLADSPVKWQKDALEHYPVNESKALLAGLITLEQWDYISEDSSRHASAFESSHSRGRWKIRGETFIDCIISAEQRGPTPACLSRCQPDRSKLLLRSWRPFRASRPVEEEAPKQSYTSKQKF